MKVLIIGAHPDDCEISAGGSAALWRKRGDDVRFVSVTDGRSGHFFDEYITDRQLLIDRRLAESEAAANVIGASWANLGAPDGELYVTPEMTEAVVREIRAFQPDLVLTNRQVDYHRDHRYTAQLVLDATFMLTVPLLYPDCPALKKMPVFAYWYDDFKEIVPFRPDVVVSVDEVLDEKDRLGAAHESQVFEWLVYNQGKVDQMPTDPTERIAWVRSAWTEPRGKRFRAACEKLLGHSLDCGQYVEAFQISDYGYRPSRDEMAVLFPAGSVIVEG